MDEIQAKLLKCFEVVFPDLAAAEIPLASQASVPTWDSVAAITLVNVLEEEFATEIDQDALPELTSFALIAQYFHERNGVAQ